MLLTNLTSIDDSWKPFVAKEAEQAYFKKLDLFLQNEYAQHTVFPPQEAIFNALKTPLHQVKIVLLGQDPYHDINQAHGFSFSVNEGVKIPPSLRNIFKELQTDIPNFITPPHGDLTQWATQGVLLLNATLTVRAHEAGSHQQQGWETFTDALIHTVATTNQHVVFMLWGAYAQSKQHLINKNNHLVLCAPHPSPLSAHRGWFGSKHFSKANAYLLKVGKQEINWYFN